MHSPASRGSTVRNKIKEECLIKKKSNLLRRVTTWIVTAAMLISTLPVLSVPVSAKKSLARKNTYKLEVWTADERNAKTDNTVYCIIKDANGHEHAFELNNSGDDFQRGDHEYYTITTELYPWEIHRVGFEHRKGIDAVKIHKFSFWLDGGPTFVNEKVINKWYNKYKNTYSIMSETDRQVTVESNKSINAFGDTYYYDSSTSYANHELTLNWNGNVTDQYYNTYNFFEADPGAVDMTFTASGKSYTGKSDINFTYLQNNKIVDTESQKNHDYVSGIKIYVGKLLKAMEDNGVYAVKINSIIDYKSDYDQYTSYTKTLTIYRTKFSLGAATATTKPYTPKKDNNFYNDTYKTVEIKIPVESRDNYNASTIASSLAKNIKDGTVDAKVYYGMENTKEYMSIEDGKDKFSAYSSGSNLYLTCTLPADFANEGGVGITVTMDDVIATYGKTYHLDTDDYHSYISTHKIDTAGPAITVNTDDVKAMESYKKSHTFRLAGNEMLYYNNTDGTRSEGFFSYRLLDDTKVKALKNYKSQPTTRVPFATNSTYTVEPTDKLEGEYTLEITARDMANNVTTKPVPVKIDNIAPRVTYQLQQSTQIDNSKRNVYTFNITDATGTGKLYYCIVPKGQTMANPAGTVTEKKTGAIENEYNEWAFIDQKTESKSVVIHVPYGEYFDGTLYWYTADSAGNDSRTEKNSGTDSKGYYSTKVNINNQTADCDLIVADSTPGLPKYDISFVTNDNNKITYHWENATTTYAEKNYTAGVNPGDVSYHGEWTLKYTVTMPNGATKTYSQTFLFDNANPTVNVKLTESAIGADKRFTVEASDINNITSLTYQLFTNKGAAVGEPIALPSGRPMVTSDVLLTPEEPGLYTVKVIAVDTNGQTTTEESPMFVIRNTTPDITFKSVVKGQNEASQDITLMHNGMPMTNDPNYTLKINVFEPLAGIEADDTNENSALEGSYYLYYRFSSDGINYGAWKKSEYEALKKNSGYIGLDSTIYVENPTVLREGENRIWMQAAFALDGTNPSTIPHQFIATAADQYIFLDTTAPTFTFELDSTERTNSAVDGTLIFSDANTAPDEIKVDYSAYGFMFPVEDNYVNAKGDDTADDDGTDNDGASDGSESAEGKTAEGETTEGETTEGESTEGENTEGETTEGETTDGESTEGDNTEGETTESVPTEAADAGERTLRIRFTRNFGDDPETENVVEDPGYIRLTDKAGNEAFVPVVIECIDTEAPWTYGENYPKSAGERQDQSMFFTIHEALAENTQYYLITKNIKYTPAYDSYAPQHNVIPSNYDDELFGPLPDNIKLVSEEVTDYYTDGETSTRYEVIVYADDVPDPNADENGVTPYALLALTTDAVGNTSKELVGEILEMKNAPTTIRSAACVPELAYDKTALKLKMSVPVFVLPQDKIPVFDPEKDTLDYRDADEIPDGRIDTSSDAEIVEFAESIVTLSSSFTREPLMIVGAIGEYPVYFADEAGRVYKQTVSVKDLDEKPETENTDPTVAYVRFGTPVSVTATIWKAANIEAARDTWTQVTEPFHAMDPSVPHYVVLTANPRNGESIELTHNFVSKEYDTNDFYLMTGYSTANEMVYRINGDTATTNRVIALDAVVTTTDAGTSNCGYVYELSLIDTTHPEINAHFSNINYTNKPVDVTVTAFDPECSVNTDTQQKEDEYKATEEYQNALAQLMASDEYNNAESDEVRAQLVDRLPIKTISAATEGIAKMEVSAIFDTMQSYSETLQYTDLGAIYETTITFEKNGYCYVRVTNTLGLVTYDWFKVDNINKKEITGDDYTVYYYDPNKSVSYEDFGHNNESEEDYYYDKNASVYYELINKNSYYREVAVSIEMKDEYASILNNGGRNTITLTAKNPKSSFHVADRYGNEAVVPVESKLFDTTAPIFAETPFTFATTAKTNQPYKVWLNVTDDQSGIKDVSAVWYGVNGAEPVTCAKETENGPYYITVANSGTYDITVTDNSGNITEKTLSVNNIDRTIPTVAAAIPTEDQYTNKDIAVKLYFSEPNVVLTSVVPTSGTNPANISVNYTDSVVRFFENGGVTATFVDEYGNVSEPYTFGVENIWRKAPDFKAEFNLAEDLLSATVTFKPNGGVPKFDLSTYYVVHSGITPMHYEYDKDGNIVSQRIQTLGDDVQFTFYENGTYYFYVYDMFGNWNKLSCTIRGIDTTAPTIKEVKWSYSYLDASGNRVEVSENNTHTPGANEIGYEVAVDAEHPATNQDVTVTVTTDKNTRPVGAKDDVKYTKDHTVVYDQNGRYNFYLEKPNGLMDSYGVGIYLIDKVAPVFAEFDDLMFFENRTANAQFNPELLKITASDPTNNGEPTDLTANIKYSYIYDGTTTKAESFADLTTKIEGHIKEDGYDKTKPVTVIYTVADAVGNETTVRRTVTFVGLFDTTIRVNGNYTDANGMIEVDGNDVTLQLDNFWGTAYAKYTSGIYTMGQMKDRGTPISGANGTFTLTDLAEGWYTFYVQTDLRDYFCVKVFVYGVEN